MAQDLDGLNSNPGCATYSQLDIGKLNFLVYTLLIHLPTVDKSGKSKSLHHRVAATNE